MAAGGPAWPTDQAVSALGPVAPGAARLTDGLWADRMERNRSAAIPAGLKQLREAGNIANFEIAAGRSAGDPIGPIFADSDVYKWLEAAAWEYGRTGDQQLLTEIDKLIELIAAAQAEDGYLNSVVPARDGGRYVDLVHHHELYCDGHLIQAAVAWSRAAGRSDLRDVAVKVADHLVATFGPQKRHDIDGHPVIEMALIELYRETGTTTYRDLARYFVDAHGQGLIAGYGAEPTYFSDRVPVRDQTTVEGHAVRAVYLAAGATDVAVETQDRELLTALETQFQTMITEKQYLTGGLGSRWDGEAFGDPFELPSDRAYAETCAAIGAVQWAWRLLLATGKSRYADEIERILYNGFLAGVSQAGTEYFYVNPLHLRANFLADSERSPGHGRRGWFGCACCPPNVMRTFASLDGYLASATGDGLQLQQYATGTIAAAGCTLAVATDYPWQPTITVAVQQAPDHEVALSFRIPDWAAGATLDGEPVRAGDYATVRKVWSPGDRLLLELPLTPRLTIADLRVDAVRGCVAIERGPLVYALERSDQPSHDQQPSTEPDDLAIDPDAPLTTEWRPDLLGGIVAVTASGVVDDHGRDDGYPSYPRSETPAQDTEMLAIPYHLWANRGAQPMRVWIPTA